MYLTAYGWAGESTEYVRLGRRGPEVSRICLGCMGFGDPSAGQHSWTIGREESREVVRSALDAGVNFFDTAVGYQGGTSEEYLGAALRELADRDDVVVATKFLPRTRDEIESGIGGKEHVLNSLDASLRHLGMDHVDLLICHMWDYGTPLEDIMAGLGEAMESGRVSHIGISNVFAWQLCEANHLADEMGIERFSSVQNHHSLVFREDEREMRPYCLHAGVSLTPYSPLASGRLCRPPGASTRRFEQDSYAHLKYDSAEAQDAEIVRRVAETAEAYSVSMTQVALSWLLTKASSPVVGATRPEQIADAAGAADLRLTDEEVAWLEEPYTPHRLVGVMAQNTADAAGREQVWNSIAGRR